MCLPISVQAICHVTQLVSQGKFEQLTGLMEDEVTKNPTIFISVLHYGVVLRCSKVKGYRLQVFFSVLVLVTE